MGQIAAVKKYWEIIADNISAKPVGVGAASQPWILAGEQSSLLTRIAATVSGLSFIADEKLMVFLELESAIRAVSVELSVLRNRS